MLHVPYKGGGPAMTDLLGGQITMMFEPLPTAITHIRAGKLKALGVTTRERVAALPDVPTIAEAGLPGYEVVVWFGLFAPAGTPPAITAKLNAELNRALNLPEVKQTLTAQGADPAPVTQERLAALLAGDQVKWGKLIRARGIKVE
jgi:tripartite-type tricarboxylate transporter receptor subunit TctC